MLQKRPDSAPGRRVEDVRFLRPIRGVLPTPSPGAVTNLLRAWSDGDDEALERLTPLVEAELPRLTRGSMSRERRGHTWLTECRLCGPALPVGTVPGMTQTFAPPLGSHRNIASPLGKAPAPSSIRKV